MCGRYFIDDENTELSLIIREIRRSSPDIRLKTGEIFPTDSAPILTAKNGKPEGAVWGFPSYKGKGVIINARAETAPEKPTFKSYFFHGRCVVPASCFYEWSPKKEKYRFTYGENGVIYLAGISGIYEGKLRFVILTTSANTSVSHIHDRMPVILSGIPTEKWLNDTDFALNYLMRDMPLLNAEPENNIKT